MHIDHLILISETKLVRTRFFAAEAERLNLPRKDTLKWGALLSKRPLSEEELGVLIDDCAQTPVAVANSIAECLAQPKVSVDVLVPRAVAYYERLVGRVEAQPTIKEYIKEVGTDHIKSLLTWRSLEGLQYALLLGSHSLVATIVAKNVIPAEVFDSALKWSINADVLSRAVLIELCFKRDSDETVIGEASRQLVKKFCEQGKGERYDQFAILSTAFIFVYAEFGRRRLLDSKPVYWRRLAAFAQAALITRCVLAERGDRKAFVEWLGGRRKILYLVQCLVDLRTDPRWLSHFVEPDQLQQELYGRVLGGAVKNQNALDVLKLREAMLNDDAASVRKRVNVVLSSLPGPLEGNFEPENDIPADILEKIREGLSSASPAISSFAVLLNHGLVFRIPSDVTNSAADALRRAQYRIGVDRKPGQLLSCLVGLAAIASSSRSQRLADELFIVIRNYRRSFREELSLDGAFQVGLVACGSREDLGEWCKCVGALISDLGFGEISHEEASALHQLVVQLCELVPELWAKCGQGLAAIEAVALS
jgi:hypothetical protein